MTPLLTTITPVWGRVDAFTIWLRAVSASFTSEVVHLLLHIGHPPNWVHGYGCDNLRVRAVMDDTPKSIGVYHNQGAQLAESEWIMKMDVDCIPHTQYFKELVEVLKVAPHRHWYNGGMYYLDRFGSNSHLTAGKMPVTVSDYHNLVQKHAKLKFPAGTNFICRRQDYLDLGGCDDRFKGYGWEDYQQIYMLERYQQGKCPLPGNIDERNVTQRCRDEISRRKADELIQMNDRFGLLHRWHETARDGDYKNAVQTSQNRKVLLDYITRMRRIESGFD